jgi:cytosol alanyl aminopeptidase
MENQRSVPADIAADVLEVAAYDGDQALFERMIATARKLTSRRDRARIFDAIGEFRNPTVVNRALALMLSGEFDMRELTRWVELFRGSPDTELLPWQFVRANYDALVARLPSQLGTAGGSILPRAGGAFCTTTGHDEVASFFRERIKTVTGGQRNLSKVLEAVQLCEARRKVQTPELERYLRSLP